PLRCEGAVRRCSGCGAGTSRETSTLPPACRRVVPAHDRGRVAVHDGVWRHVVDHDGTFTDERAPTDTHARRDDATPSEVGAVLDHDGPAGGRRTTGRVVERTPRVGDDDVVGRRHAFADDDLLCAHDLGTGRETGAVADHETGAVCGVDGDPAV